MMNLLLNILKGLFYFFCIPYFVWLQVNKCKIIDAITRNG